MSNKIHIADLSLSQKWQLLQDLHRDLQSEYDEDLIVCTYPAMTDRARKYATRLHRKCGQFYGDKKYSYHLEMVVENVKQYCPRKWKDEGLLDELVCAAWCHDTIEDCAITYNDLKKVIGERPADLVYLLTNELGKNRSQRHERTSPKLASNKKAAFVKCCDRLANTHHSKSVKSGMYEKYCKEYPSFRKELGEDTGYLSIFPRIWSALDSVHKFSKDNTSLKYRKKTRTHSGRRRIMTIPIELVHDSFKKRHKTHHDEKSDISVTVYENSVIYVERDGKCYSLPAERLETYLEKGVECRACGIEGSHYAVETDPGRGIHIDLYTKDPDGHGEVMITRDHIMPRHLGGLDHLDNYQPLCKCCNESKGHKLTHANFLIKDYDAIDDKTILEIVSYPTGSKIMAIQVLKEYKGYSLIEAKKLLESSHQSKCKIEVSHTSSNDCMLIDKLLELDIEINVTTHKKDD